MLMPQKVETMWQSGPLGVDLLLLVVMTAPMGNLVV